MGDKTGIEWSDATWNCVTGCSKVSQGCKFCYAERVFPRVYGKDRKFTDVVCHEDRLDQPLRWRKHRMIFVNSMSDLFHEDIPTEFIDRVFGVMTTAWWHTFQILTKRPERMRSYLSDPVVHERWNAASVTWRKKYYPASGGVTSQWLRTYSDNIWLGVSVEDQATADERVPLLIDTPATVRFLSYEPALGYVDSSKYLKSIDWVIAGGESGPNARPVHPVWFWSMRDQCTAAGTKFLFKQWGEWAPATTGVWLHPLHDGPQFKPRASGKDCHDFGDGYGAVRVGKKNSGRLLDGVVWDEYPS